MDSFPKFYDIVITKYSTIISGKELVRELRNNKINKF